MHDKVRRIYNGTNNMDVGSVMPTPIDALMLLNIEYYAYMLATLVLSQTWYRL